MFADELDYLRSFDPNIELLQASELGDDIPASWHDVFALPNEYDQVEAALNLWQPLAAKIMPLTWEYLNDAADGVHLARFGGRIAMLYGIDPIDDHATYYAGGNPLELSRFPQLNSLWEKLPEGLYDFYAHVHSGFYYYPSEDGGPLPPNQIFVLGELDWQILDELHKPLQVNLETTVALFANGGGGYIGYDYENKITVNWWATEQPTYHESFWPQVDEWTKISLEY